MTIMNISDEIEKLQNLHSRGVLTDDEFVRAKANVLAAPSEVGNRADSLLRDSSLQKIQQQNDVAQIDREWQIEREKYMVTGKYGSRSLPTAGGSVLMGVLVGGFGIFWTISAASMGAPAFFPLFGVIFILIAVGSSISNFNKANQYRQAEQKYQERRAGLLSKIDHGDR